MCLHVVFLPLYHVTIYPVRHLPPAFFWQFSGHIDQTKHSKLQDHRSRRQPARVYCMLVFRRHPCSSTMQSPDLSGLLNGHERSPANTLSNVPPSTLPRQRRHKGCNTQGRRGCSSRKTCCKRHTSRVTAVARSVLGCLHGRHHLPSGALLLSRYPCCDAKTRSQLVARRAL